MGMDAVLAIAQEDAAIVGKTIQAADFEVEVGPAVPGGTKNGAGSEPAGLPLVTDIERDQVVPIASVNVVECGEIEDFRPANFGVIAPIVETNRQAIVVAGDAAA